MNIIDLIIKFIFNQVKGQDILNPVEIAKQVFDQLKVMLKSLIVIFICSVIFCLLTGYLIDRILSQLDSDSFQFTNSIIFLFVLIAINTAVMLSTLKKASAKNEEMTTKDEAVPSLSESPIETAIAALIFDFIKEREDKRVKANESKQSTESHT